MTEEKQGGEFKSLLVKASLMESSQDNFDVSNESFNMIQEDIGFIMAFEKLIEHQKIAATNGLRCDFLGNIVAIEEAIARNSKHYLKLQLQDIHGKTFNLCLFEETAYYCSVQEFTERYLLSEQHPLIFIQALQWDGKYLSVDKWSLLEHGESHPQAAVYKQVEEYLLLKLLPKENDQLARAIGSSFIQAEKLVQSALALLEQQKGTDNLRSEQLQSLLEAKIAEIAYAKTYSGTSYLLQGEEQTPISNDYMNYFLGQLQAILEIVVGSKNESLTEITLICVLERWQRELVSLHEFERIQNQKVSE